MKAGSPRSAVVKLKLRNGVTVVLQEDSRTPLFSLHVAVRAGTVTEGRWLGSGISHFLEHVIDDGTRNRSRDEIDALVESLGNVSNAYTARDHSRYFLTASRDRADEAFELFADFLQNPLLPEEEVAVHRGVILNEFAQIADNPDEQLMRSFYETLYRVHPYRVPIEGYPAQFEQLTREDLVQYHREVYVPQNIVVSVVGDLDMERVGRRLQELWEPMPERGWTPPPIPREPAQLAPRETVREGSVEIVHGLIGWRTGSYFHSDAAALALLGLILGGSEGAVLVRRLKEDRRLVHDLYSWTELPVLADGFLAVGFTCDPGRESAVQEAVREEVQRIQETGIAPEVLETAKAIAEAESWFGSQTIEDVAATLAYDELLLGDAEQHRRFLERLRTVTQEAVQRAAACWLQETHRNTALLVPRPTRARAVRNRLVRAQRSEPPLERCVLANGLRIVVQEDHSQPTAFLGLFFRGGAYAETERTSGLFALATRTALRGTKRRSLEEIVPAIEARGGLIEAVAGNHSFGFHAGVLSRDVPFAVELLAEVSRRPLFHLHQVNAVRQELLAALRAASEDAEEIAYRALLRAFYAHHPYRRTPGGTWRSLRCLRPEDCRSVFERYARPNNAVLCAVGDLSPEELLRLVREQFGDWEPLPVPERRTLSPRRRRGVRLFEPREMTQTILMIGYPGVSFLHPDADAMLVLQAALAGLNYPGGRLYRALRQRQLVYEVSAEHRPGVDTGMFLLYAATQPENVDAVLRTVDETVAEVQERPLPPEEYRRVQSMCLADFFIHLQTHEERVYRIGLDELYGFGYDYVTRYADRIQAIAASQVQQVAQRYPPTRGASDQHRRADFRGTPAAFDRMRVLRERPEGRQKAEESSIRDAP
ncbi:MAG: peptidase M16 [Candidatus Poribacteria bacterium]|nr:MAG: peptidase M16 [Candidatus Poribacteria bacterium]